MPTYVVTVTLIMPVIKVQFNDVSISYAEVYRDNSGQVFLKPHLNNIEIKLISAMIIKYMEDNEYAKQHAVNCSVPTLCHKIAPILVRIVDNKHNPIRGGESSTSSIKYVDAVSIPPLPYRIYVHGKFHVSVDLHTVSEYSWYLDQCTITSILPGTDILQQAIETITWTKFGVF